LFPTNSKFYLQISTLYNVTPTGFNWLIVIPFMLQSCHPFGVILKAEGGGRKAEVFKLGYSGRDYYSCSLLLGS